MRPGAASARLLLCELIARCEAAGARQMLAVIGDSANAALDRRAPGARVHARRHAARRRLEVRPLARRRPDAAKPRRRRHHGAGMTPPAAPPGLARRPSPPGSRWSAAASACTASTCTGRATSGAWLHAAADAGRRVRLLAHARVRRRRRARLAARAAARRHARRDDAAGDRLRSDERGALGPALARRRAGGAAAAGRPCSRSALALAVGVGVAVATIAFTAQRYFESIVEVR